MSAPLPPDRSPDARPSADAVAALNPDRVALRPEHDALARALVAVLREDLDLPRAGARLVIGVAGESGSGKSITATNLARHLTAGGAPTAVLHQDDYFVRPPRANHAHRLRDLAAVGPHEVDLARLAAQVAAFRAGRDAVEGPLVDYPNDRFVPQRHDFAARAVLVVEGTYALLLPDLDVRIFLAATHEETAERRRARARDAHADAHAAFVDAVLAREHARIAPQGAAADVVVDRDHRVVRRPGGQGTAPR